jgi:membrane-bound serine protease (ClpP class)
MIALACNEIVMQPGSKLGDCAPIAIGAGGELATLGAAERAKMESPILQDFAESAHRNGYDPLLVQSMVSVGRVVRWMENADGERRFVDQAASEKLAQDGWHPVAGVSDPIDSADQLFTTGADLAVKLGLASGVAPSAPALASSRGLSVLATFQPAAGEALIGFLGSSLVRGLLTTIFLFTLYIAFSHPGHGMAEVGAVISLGVLVGVPLLTGYAQWWEILAILIGLFLIALEIFVIPGFGVTGITGIVMLLFGLVMTWVGSEPSAIPGILPQLPATQQALKRGVEIVVTGMVCSLLLWFWLQRYLPKLPYFNKLILATPSGNVDVAPSNIDGAVQAVTWPAVGSQGRAMTDLKPGGTAAFFDAALNDSRVTDVVSDSGYVPAQTAVVVREVQGNRVVVRAMA